MLAAVCEKPFIPSLFYKRNLAMLNTNDLPNTFEEALLGTSEITLTNPVSSALEVDCGDADFLKVFVEYGRTYSIVVRDEGVLEPVLELDIFSAGGFKQKASKAISINQDGVHYVTFNPRYSGYYYFSVGHNFSPGSQDLSYSASLSKITQDSGTSFLPHGAIDLDTAFIRLDDLFDADDRDPFGVYLKPNRMYTIDVLAVDSGNGTLANPWVGIQLGTTSFYNDDGGEGRNAQIRFTTPAASLLENYVRRRYVSVGGTGAGSYQVRMRVNDDFTGDSTTTGRLRLTRERQDEGIFADLSTTTDIDWFKASLSAGKFYEFQVWNKSFAGPSSSGVFIHESLPAPQLMARDPSFNLLGTVAHKSAEGFDKLSLLVQAEMTGDYYAVVRNAERSELLFGDYRINVSEARAPIGRKFQNAINAKDSNPLYVLVDNQSAALQDLFATTQGNRNFPYSTIQVYSSVPPQKNGATMVAGQTYSIFASEVSAWTVPGGFSKSGNVFIRAQVGAEWSSWLNVPFFCNAVVGRHRRNEMAIGRPAGEHFVQLCKQSAIVFPRSLHGLSRTEFCNGNADYSSREIVGHFESIACKRSRCANPDFPC
jgi:hypothetical protein